MKIAIIVEGENDKDTIPIFIKRSISSDTTVITRVLRGRGNLFKARKIIAITRSILSEYSDVSLVLVFVDSECTPENKTEQEIKKIEKSIKENFVQKISLHYVGVIHALEGWLLGDTRKIKEYLGVNVPSNATAECKPKEIMKKLFKKAPNKDFIRKIHYSELAKEIDLNQVARRNKSFNKFLRLLKNR